MNPNEMPGFETGNMPSSDELEAQKNMEELMKMGADFRASGGEVVSGVDSIKETNKERNFISYEDLPIYAQKAVDISRNKIIEGINIKSDEERKEIESELNLRWFNSYQFMNGKLMEWGGKNINAETLGKNLYESIGEEAKKVLEKKIKGIEFKEN